MDKAVMAAAAATLSAGTVAQPVSFDALPVGAEPAGWTCGVTGQGAPRWTVAAEGPSASGAHVLLQSGSGTFPWCVLNGVALTDGFVQVSFKPISGREDQAGGVVWRWKDGDQYYVARANALEGNVSLYRTERGSRKTIRYAAAPVRQRAWHTLRVDFAGTRIAVALDGRRAIELDDSHVAGGGSVGVWTKADSVTAFKDFSYGTAAHPPAR